MRRTIIPIVCGICIVLAAGFGYLVWTAIPISVEYADAATIEQHQHQWEAQTISNYRIALNYITFGADLSVQITIENGHVVATECREHSFEGACRSLNPNVFTVPSLFAAARKLSAEADPIMRRHDTDQLPPFSIGFDPTYHFPRYMVWQLSEYTRWEVKSFTALP